MTVQPPAGLLDLRISGSFSRAAVAQPAWGCLSAGNPPFSAEQRKVRRSLVHFAGPSVPPVWRERGSSADTAGARCSVPPTLVLFDRCPREGGAGRAAVLKPPRDLASHLTKTALRGGRNSGSSAFLCTRRTSEHSIPHERSHRSSNRNACQRGHPGEFISKHNNNKKEKGKYTASINPAKCLLEA